MRVILFPTCLVEKAGTHIEKATEKILTTAGIKVIKIKKSTCCGQIAFNMGDWKSARDLAKVWLKTYITDINYDAIILPSGSCTFMIRKNFPKLFQNEPESLKTLSQSLNKIFELTEFIWKYNLMEKIKPKFPHRVTYHPSCHYLRGLKIKNEPKVILKKVDGLQLIEMENEELCCGFGGLFSVKMSDVSLALANRKASYIIKTNAEFVTTPDLSCLLNLEGILLRNNANIKAVHISEILSAGL